MSAADITDTATYYLGDSSKAWAFMHACDAAGLRAGFPDLKAPTVKVSIPTWMAREAADKLAGEAPIAYEFAHCPACTHYGSNPNDCACKAVSEFKRSPNAPRGK